MAQRPSPDLANNLNSVDFSVVLADVMTIADEVDAQLKQAIISFLHCEEAQNSAAG